MCDVSNLRNLCLKLQKVDKGNGRDVETMTLAFPPFCNYTYYLRRIIETLHRQSVLSIKNNNVLISFEWSLPLV